MKKVKLILNTLMFLSAAAVTAINVVNGYSFSSFLGGLTIGCWLYLLINDCAKDTTNSTKNK